MIRTLVGLALLLAVEAHAHGRSVSYSTWTPVPAGARVELRVTALDVTLLGLDPWTDGDAIAAWATTALRAAAAGGPCRPAAPRRSDRDDGSIVLAWDVACPAGPVATIASDLFADVAPSHIHLARLVGVEGAVTEQVLTVESSRWTLDADDPSAAAASLGDYVLLGLEHIATGWDHLAFVLALLLLAASLAEVAAIVTAFTVAHSLSLAAAVTGLVHPEGGAVEAVIGFSIALVAAENLWLMGGRDRATPWVVAAALVAAILVPSATIRPAALAGLAVFALCHLGLLGRSARPARLRALVAFAFGLVHGLGFAGVLAELELPRLRLAGALLGFNVGVEIGQLAVVASGWVVLGALGRVATSLRRGVAELGSATVLALGLFWLVVRVWG